MTDKQQVATRQPSAIGEFRVGLQQMEPQFKFALPTHIPVERFIRVVMTAVQNNPALLRCTKQSLFNACMKSAQDGLLPDNREAALVPFGEDVETGRSKPDQAAYIPLVRGIRKLARDSGMLSDWHVEAVLKGD
jgi:recombination protein RecT